MDPGSVDDARPAPRLTALRHRCRSSHVRLRVGRALFGASLGPTVSDGRQMASARFSCTGWVTLEAACCPLFTLSC